MNLKLVMNLKFQFVGEDYCPPEFLEQYANLAQIMLKIDKRVEI
jgi:hypothetical protein